MIKKSFFEQFKKDIAEENEKYEAHNESVDLSRKVCKHTKPRFNEGKLICTCGAVWTGPGLNTLYSKLIHG